MGIGGATANRGTQVTVDRSSIEAESPRSASTLLELAHGEHRRLRHDPGVLVGRLRRQRDRHDRLLDVRQLVLASGNGAKRFVSTNNVFYDTLHNNTNTLAATIPEHHYDLAYPQAVNPNGTNNNDRCEPT